MRTRLGLVLLAALALAVPAAAPGKGFARVVLLGADGRSVEVRAAEATIDGLLSRRGAGTRIRGAYLRLFFVGSGDFPANPARYYPDARCVALDWPTYETTCGRVRPALVRLLSRGRSLPRFRRRPTVLAGLRYLGTTPNDFGGLVALRSPVALALGRRGEVAPKPSGCYGFAGSWRGPAAARRAQSFLVCADGVHAGGRRHPLGRGVWQWLRLNLGPPAARRPLTWTASGLSVLLPPGWRVVHRRLTPCTNPLERLTVTGRRALVMLQESLDPRRYIRRFSPRPPRFTLRGEPHFIACCAPPGRGRGWFFDFRDAGRGFYAYVYLGDEGTREEALGILDSLRVRPRPRS